MMNIQIKRPAFSMLELIFVIVILGIVASIGSEIVAKVYEGYIVQRAEHHATLKTELAATQIANRLQNAIAGTVIRRVGKTGTAEELSQTMAYNPNAYSVLQWVGHDNDSFEAITSAANRKPGWSGFCDVNASLANSISTPGSNLGLADTIIRNLSGDTKTIADAAIYFPHNNTAHNVSAGIAETITLDSNAARIVEHYKLAWSSYALVVEPNAEGGNDLNLYYNFTPSPATAIGNTSSLIMKNISSFKFQGAGRTIRFKICKQERISEDLNITACKEKAVF